MKVVILGRQPALGIAEIESLYGAQSIKHVHDGYALVDTEFIDINKLGGTLKTGEQLTSLSTHDWAKILAKTSAFLTDYLRVESHGKITIGISLYGFKLSPAKINAGSLSIKKALKSKTRPVRIVPNKETSMSTAQVLHNKLTQSGGLEIMIVRSGKHTIIAKTTGVQDINAYTARDQARPARDARVGMLPPKLAQIIINFAQADCDKTLLDPFCGTGVVLQEALLMGLPSVYGTDLEPRMIEYSDQNLEWLHRVRHTPLTHELAVGDATSHTWAPMTDVIACETYLGRALTQLPDRETLTKIMNDCDTIHKKFLINVAHQTEPGFRMCIAVPAWKSPQGFKHMQVLDNLDSLGYNRVKFVHAKTEDLIYYRPGQTVARELVVLERI